MTLLEQLKQNLYENHPESRFFSDAELSMLLEHNHRNVNAASYEGLLKKAQADGITLPDGTKTADCRAYWLSLAKHYRPAQAKSLARADEDWR